MKNHEDVIEYKTFGQMLGCIYDPSHLPDLPLPIAGKPQIRAGECTFLAHLVQVHFYEMGNTW